MLFPLSVAVASALAGQGWGLSKDSTARRPAATEEHRPQRSVLLAVDRAEGSAIQIAVRSVRSREVFRPLGSRQLSSHVRARKR